MTDVMTLLSEANPVRVEAVPQMDVDLLDSILARGRRPRARVVLAVAIALAALAASLIGVFVFGGGERHPGLGPNALGPGQPLKSIPLADASATLGAPLILPNTALVQSSDAAPDVKVAGCTGDTNACTIYVSFPAQALAIGYTRPAPLDDYEADVANARTHHYQGHLVDLAGVRAVWIDYPGVKRLIEFAAGGTQVIVSGNYDEATLQAVAQSIVDQEGGGSSVIGPADAMATLDRPLGGSAARPITLAAAPSILGGPIVLPDSSFVHPADAGAVWGASVHESDGESSSSVGVAFPSQGLIIQYMRPPIPDPLANFQGFARDNPGSSVIDLNGTSARAIAQTSDPGSWGSIEFVAGGTTIAVMGQTDPSTLQPVAQSILDRSRG